MIIKHVRFYFCQLLLSMWKGYLLTFVYTFLSNFLCFLNIVMTNKPVSNNINPEIYLFYSFSFDSTMLTFLWKYELMKGISFDWMNYYWILKTLKYVLPVSFRNRNYYHYMWYIEFGAVNFFSKPRKPGM